MKKRSNPDLIFEEALSDDWSWDFDIREVSLDEKPLLQVGAVVVLLIMILTGRVFYLNVVQGKTYVGRAEANLGRYELIPAPRGIITDRFGTTIAENKPVFSAYLDVNEFLHKKDQEGNTLNIIERVLGTSKSDVMEVIQARNADRVAEPLLLAVELNQDQLVALKEANDPLILVKDGFRRNYPEGKAFTSVLGYIGLPTAKDLARNPELTGGDYIGKSGLESYYEDSLRGKPGLMVKIKDAKGKELTAQERTPPQIGDTLTTTIDGEFQKYLYERMAEGLRQLGRTSGVALAMNPQTGEVLAFLNFPTYDNNIFSTAGHSAERVSALTDSTRPLFDRAVAGLYSPGSTIKPLVGWAAMAENIIDPAKTIFSPGYLDIPNPYDPSKPTRYLDWKYQGDVNLASAIAQSSDVYFYEVGGGFPGQKGLGITKLRQWWQKFGLDQKTGIDMPGENTGFLPSADWKQKTRGRPWVLGDTYNVSIGQGDLQITPIALLNYIAAIGNGGKLIKPILNKNSTTAVLADYSNMTFSYEEVQKGMEMTVKGSNGTAYLMHDLPFTVGGKTGSAQIHNNQAENAFFVGYAPAENPQIAILVLVEESKEGSLNTIPIAKDALNWYYAHRLKK